MRGLIAVVSFLVLTDCVAAESGSVEWSDRRPIGALFLARAETGWRTNSRGWFNDEHLDVTTSSGRRLPETETGSLQEAHPER
jgi:hypothetical protein